MAMGHRERMVSGDEFDALTRWKRVLRWKSGERKRQKRIFNKRSRKAAKMRSKRRGTRYGASRYRQ